MTVPPTQTSRPHIWDIEGIERNVENHGRDRLRDVDDSYRWRPALATRQMSNNGEVEYDGDSFYFSWDSAGPVNDIGRASGRLVVPGKRGAARQAANVHRGRRNGADRALAVFMDGDEACS
jgi:hypothetical protein